MIEELDRVTLARVAGAVCVAALPPLLWARWRNDQRLIAATKIAASAGFLGLGLLVPALDAAFALPVRIGLCLSFLGDVFLLGVARRWVLAGLAAFLLAHLAYVAAAAPLAVADARVSLIALGVMSAGAVLVWFWIRTPAANRSMRGPAGAYVATVSLSAAALLAGGMAAPAERWALVVAGPLLWISDLAVARQRLMVDSFWNRAWGLPAYYVGQLLVASALATTHR